MGELIDELMSQAMCAMCGEGVHFEAGRVACDGCDLPTDCCLCEPLPILRAYTDPPPEVRALESRESPARRLALPSGSGRESSSKRRTPKPKPKPAPEPAPTRRRRPTR
jgi:hypothetical protein